MIDFKNNRDRYRPFLKIYKRNTFTTNFKNATFLKVASKKLMCFSLVLLKGVLVSLYVSNAKAMMFLKLHSEQAILHVKEILL